MVEISIKVSDDEKSLIQKYLHYPIANDPSTDITMSHDDPLLSKWVNETVSQFKGTPSDIIVKTKYVW